MTLINAEFIELDAIELTLSDPYGNVTMEYFNNLKEVAETFTPDFADEVSAFLNKAYFE